MILEIFNSGAGNGTETGTGTSTCKNDQYQGGDIGKSGVGLLVSVFLLITWELIQMVRLGKLYFKEIENYMEMFVFSTALLLLFTIKTRADEEDIDDVSRGIVAVGISLGWIELVFLTGRLGLITR